MDNFIAETGFKGTYTFSNDERIFDVLKGTFPLPQVTGQDTFVANCDSIIKIIMKMYGTKADDYSMSYPKQSNRGSSIEKNIDFSAWSAQTYNGLQLIVMANQEAQNYSWYADYVENPDSCTWYGEYFGKKNKNHELKLWRQDSDTHPINGYIVIQYKSQDNIYVIENMMFLKPVVMPLLKITKDDALAIAAEKHKDTVYERKLKLYAIPKDEFRNDFDIKYIWTVEGYNSSGHSGVVYSIDGTTGKILFEDYWIE
jgi:hypothetical protein